MEISTYKFNPQTLPAEIKVMRVSPNDIDDFAAFLEKFYGYGKVTYKKTGQKNGSYGPIFESAGSITYDFYFRNLPTDKRGTKFDTWTFSDYGEIFIIDEANKSINKICCTGISLSNYIKV